MADLHKQVGAIGAESQSRHAPVHGATVATERLLADVRHEALGLLHPVHGMDVRTVAGSVSPSWRDQVPEVLDTLTADGLVARDGTKYLLSSERIPA